MNKVKKNDRDNMDRFNQWDNSPEDHSSQQQAQASEPSFDFDVVGRQPGSGTETVHVGNRPGTVPAQ